jgi:hypothetical protein
LLILNLCCFASAQQVEHPIARTVEFARKVGSYYPVRSYYQWSIDLNNDGLKDMLVSEKERPDEIDLHRQADRFFFNPAVRGFDVYIRLSKGGYVSAVVKEGDKPEAGGMLIDISHCYVGYVSEAKGFGMVTVESMVVDDPERPQARHGVLKSQLVCYTIAGKHIHRTNLTPQYDAGAKNAVYDKYLSEPKADHLPAKSLRGTAFAVNCDRLQVSDLPINSAAPTCIPHANATTHRGPVRDSHRGIAQRLRDVFVLGRRPAGSAGSAKNAGPHSRRRGRGFGSRRGRCPRRPREIRISMEPVTGIELLDK